MRDLIHGPPYILSASALRDFLSSSDSWKRWDESIQANYKREGSTSNKPFGLFLSAHTFFVIRLAVETSHYDEYESDKTSFRELLDEFSNGAFEGRIIPVTAPIATLASKIFSKLEAELDNGEEIPIEPIIESSMAIINGATIVFSHDDDEYARYLSIIKGSYPELEGWQLPGVM